MSSLDKNAARALMAFVRNYTDALEQNLQAVQLTMREAVDGVMKGINEISQKTAEKRREANEVIVSTYTNPDAETLASMDSMQNEVDRVMSLARESQQSPAETISNQEADELRTQLRRSAGFFSKHLEALETLDGDLQSHLMAMMGVLSADDVISQRIQHVQMGLNALQTSLTYLLTDFENRSQPPEIERFIADLKAFALRTYSSEEERRLFYRCFAEEPPKPRKKSA